MIEASAVARVARRAAGELAAVLAALALGPVVLSLWLLGEIPGPAFAIVMAIWAVPTVGVYIAIQTVWKTPLETWQSVGEFLAHLTAGLLFGWALIARPPFDPAPRHLMKGVASIVFWVLVIGGSVEVLVL